MFAEADRVDAVILFDEADAVFGKRSETKDAHDRYANMESAYLLQRLESFNGVALLTTNLRGQHRRRLHPPLRRDRRLPLPRRRTAQGPVAALPGRRASRWSPTSPTAPHWTGVADRFELAGGAIRAAATTAAYLPPQPAARVSAEDLLTGAQREYRKMGRLAEEDLVFNI